jgi:hypothetical protein
MKTDSRHIPPRGLEILEARIAPAGIFTFTDTDGDAVTVSSTRGTDADLAAAIQPFLAASGAGFQLQKVALSSAPAIFRGTTLVISAATATGGDGFVDVGSIDATGLDLRSVTIDGDLGQIDAGDTNVQTTALRSLRAASLGVRGLATQGTGGSLVSTIFGGVGSFVLDGDLRDATFQVLGSAIDPDPNVHSALDAAAIIGAVRIDGSVVGGDAAGSGQVFAKGRIGTLALGGSIVGGDGAESGRIWVEGGISTATIGQSIVGGTDPAATSSGQLFAGGKSGKILVRGKLVGGAGADSGVLSNGRGLDSVTIQLSIEGGAGERSGTVASAGKIALVSIGDGVAGGTGDESGVIRSTGAMTTVNIVGDVRGGAGDRSGLVGSETTIGRLTVEGSVLGGLGAQSGALGSIGALGHVKVAEDVRGGAGPRSGQIVSEASIKSVTVGGSVIGGSSFETGAIGSFGGLGPVVISGDLLAGTGAFSGTIQAGAEDQENGAPASIASVTIGGSVDALLDDGSAGPHAAAILTDGALGPVIVRGDVLGGASVDTGTIVASTIKSVRIDGSLRGGAGDSSGVVRAITTVGPATVGQDVTGGDGESSGALLSGGDMGAVKIGGALSGGTGDFSGLIETQGEPADSSMATVKITGAILGGLGRNSGSIHSSGKLAGAEAAELRGFDGTLRGGVGSGSISSELDMGAVKIAGSILGGTADEGGKITSGGKLASLTVGGSLIGGSGDYDTTAGDLDEIGQVFALGALGPVKISQHLSGGSGQHSGEIRAASIQSVSMGTYLEGGSGNFSGGFTSTSGDIGPVTMGASIDGGSAPVSGFMIAARDLVSLRTEAIGTEVGGRALLSAARRIGSVIVVESMEFADIIAGIDIAQQQTNAPSQIESVVVGTGSHGEFVPFILASNIVASALPGEDGDFGTFDDLPTSGSGLSRIGSVVINGEILDPIGRLLEEEIGVRGSNFGIVADHVVRVIVAGQTIAQQTGPTNDFIPLGESTVAINEMEGD